MRSALAAVLICEAIIVGLATPVAISLSDVGTVPALVGGGVVALGCVVAGALLRNRAGIVLGSVMQVVALALGFVVPMMFVLGAIFGALWIACIVLDRRLARQAAGPDTT